MKKKNLIIATSVVLIIILVFILYKFYVAYSFFIQINQNMVSRGLLKNISEDIYGSRKSNKKNIIDNKGTFFGIPNFIKKYKPIDCYPDIVFSESDLKKHGFISKDYNIDFKKTNSYLYSKARLNFYITNNPEACKIYMNDLIPERNESYYSVKEKILSENIEKIIPSNLNDFRFELIPAVKIMMSKKELKNSLSLSERKNLPKIDLDYYFDLTNKSIPEYWYLLSKAFIKNKEYENALLISHAIFYLTKNIESSFFGITFISSNINIQIFNNSRACDAILSWASNPKPNCKELSKAVALDILDFVETDVGLADSIEYEYEVLKDYLNNLSKRGCNKIDLFLESKEYDFLKNIYKSSKEIVDKPILEAKKELEKLERYYTDYLKKCEKDVNSFYVGILHYAYNYKLTRYLFSNSINPYKTIIIDYLGVVNMVKDIKELKISKELLLAKMELAAIALAINAYVSENNKLPESINELSKWFGHKLPDNRFTNEPYELNLTGKHLIYNNGIDGKKDLSNKNVDDLFFDFSM